VGYWVWVDLRAVIVGVGFVGFLLPFGGYLVEIFSGWWVWLGGWLAGCVLFWVCVGVLGGVWF